MLSASSIVSGNFLPRVSGKKFANIPATNATTPKRSRGKKSNINFNNGTKGAVNKNELNLKKKLNFVIKLPSSAPNRENVERAPTPPDLYDFNLKKMIKIF
jgi:hypothetical protein